MGSTEYQTVVCEDGVTRTAYKTHGVGSWKVNIRVLSTPFKRGYSISSVGDLKWVDGEKLPRFMARGMHAHYLQSVA
jgi:hypothetical protein